MSSDRLLIVEDEKNIRLFLERMLTGQGYSVTAVGTGEEALSFIQSNAFDLAILDLNLGYGISGMEVLARLRENSPDTCIILLTGHGTLETAIEALRQGAHDYLLKPATVDEIRDSVRRGLQKRRQQQQQTQQERVLNQLEQNLESLRRLRSMTVEPVAAEQNKLAIPQQSAGKEPGMRFLQHGGIKVDLAQHIVTIDGRELELSPTEFDILVYLLAEAPRIVSPQELVSQTLGYRVEQWEASGVIRTHIYRLRQKIKETIEGRDIVRTVRGLGYTIEV
jgi:DNA-binding response OmpR family regulator